MPRRLLVHKCQFKQISTKVPGITVFYSCSYCFEVTLQHWLATKDNMYSAPLLNSDSYKCTYVAYRHVHKIQLLLNKLLVGGKITTYGGRYLEPYQEPLHKMGGITLSIYVVSKLHNSHQILHNTPEHTLKNGNRTPNSVPSILFASIIHAPLATRILAWEYNTRSKCLCY